MTNPQPGTRQAASAVAVWVGLLTLYFTEDQVLPWLAYSRYMLYPLFLLSLMLVPLSTTLLQQNRRATVVAIRASRYPCSWSTR